MLLEGRQLDRYHILHHLGSGGTGDVYLAEDQHIGQTVAIKVVRVEEGMQTVEVQRATELFLREARTIVTLDHPNILALFDYGMQEVDGRPVIYLVMPYRREGSLAQWLKKRSHSGPLPRADVAFFVQQAANALQHAHDRGVIHQDVKPSNFLLRNNDTAPTHPDLLLADFGAARLSTMTASVSMGVRGTPAYMAPEQWNGKPVFASDQYGLAIMTYELLTWHYPFQGQMAEIMFHHFNDAPPPPSRFVPTLSSEVDEVLLHALAKEPQQRFARVSAFARAFQQAAPDREPGVVSPQQRNIPGNTGGQPRIVSSSLNKNISGGVPAQAPSGQDLTRIPTNWKAPGTSEGLREIPPPPPTPYLPDAVAHPGTPSPTPVLPSSTPSPTPVLPSSIPSPTPVLYPSVLPPTPVRPPVVPPPQSQRLKLALILGSILVLIGSSVFGITGYMNKIHVDATQTAIDAGAATAHAGTAAANTQETAAARNTAQANASSTASVASTATAFVAPTATTIAANPYPAYLPGHGTLALYDSLQQEGAWKNVADNNNSGGSCQFSNGAYHARETRVNMTYLCFDSFTYDNFAIEVPMTVTQGDCGGIAFRYSGTAKTYVFEVCQDRFYGLGKYINNTNSSLLPTVSPDNAAIKAGLNQTNLLAVVANGGKITLFVNRVQIAEVQDTAPYTTGYLALIGGTNTSSSTDVVYRNVIVWKL